MCPQGRRKASIRERGTKKSSDTLDAEGPLQRAAPIVLSAEQKTIGETGLPSIPAVSNVKGGWWRKNVGLPPKHVDDGE